MAIDDAFLSRVTHDLRGELATMVAGLHYLTRYEAGLGDTGRQMLERVSGAGQRLRRLLDELELSVWIEGEGFVAPGAVPAPEPGRFEPLVQAALGRLERLVAQRAVTVELELGAELPEVVGDLELLGAAVELLLDFAVSRSPGRVVRVGVTCAGGALVLRVEDEGGLVEPAVLARVFEPFVEKELVPRPEPGARRRERLGLGLGIARGIFAAHGGSVTAAPGEKGIVLTGALGLAPGAGCREPPSV